MKDQGFPQYWHDAKTQFQEHLDSERGPGCSFGGMSMSNWYWMTVDSCELSHGDKCMECGEPADHPIRGRGELTPGDGVEMWELAFCDEHMEPLKVHFDGP